MSIQSLTSIIGGIAFATAVVSAYLHLRHRLGWSTAVLRIAALLGLAANIGYFIHAVSKEGAAGIFRNNFDSTLLLATLVALVGIGVHWAKTLQGLDGFLFIVAAVVNFGALGVLDYPSNPLMDRPWFVSHTMSFALSAACFISSGVAGIAYSIMYGVLHKKHPTPLVGHVASLESLERFGRWMLTVGYPLFLYGILTGVCGVVHITDTERAAWRSDPLVVFSFITLLLYTVMFYCVLFRPQLRGRRAALLSAGGMVIILVVFLVIDFLSPLHR